VVQKQGASPWRRDTNIKKSTNHSRWEPELASEVFNTTFKKREMRIPSLAHSTTLGVAANPIIPPMKIEEYEDGFLMDAPFPALESPHEQPGKL